MSLSASFKTLIPWIVPAAILLLVASCSGERDAEHATPDATADGARMPLHEGTSPQPTEGAAGQTANPTQSGSNAEVLSTDASGAVTGSDTGAASAGDMGSASGTDALERAAVEPAAEEDGPPAFPKHIRMPALRSPGSRPQAPAVPMTDLDGRKITMEQLRGQVVLLTFWATWCPPCKREIPHLVHLQATYGDLGFTVLAPSLDQKGLAVIKPFLRSRPDINYTIIPNGHPLSMAYGGVNRIPTTYLIDKQGRVIEQIMGSRSGEELEGLVMAALKEGG
jgi:thiol-disulfide isomerase/thioredoxin